MTIGTGTAEFTYHYDNDGNLNPAVVTHVTIEKSVTPTPAPTPAPTQTDRARGDADESRAGRCGVKCNKRRRFDENPRRGVQIIVETAAFARDR